MSGARVENRPLTGKRIVVTRARARAGPLTRALSDLGADVIEMPAIAIEPLDASRLRDALNRLSEYQWAVFTSQNAVEIFWTEFRALSLDARTLKGVRVAAIGPATEAALVARGIVPDMRPARFVAEGLLESLSARSDVAGSRILYATAEGARDVLATGLSALGASVDRIPVYRAVPQSSGADELRERLLAGEVDLVTFTSASSVTAFVAAVGADAARLAPAASIGPVTSEAARVEGLTVGAEAAESTVDALVAAIAAAGD